VKKDSSMPAGVQAIRHAAISATECDGASARPSPGNKRRLSSYTSVLL